MSARAAPKSAPKSARARREITSMQLFAEMDRLVASFRRARVGAPNLSFVVHVEENLRGSLSPEMREMVTALVGELEDPV